MFEVWMAKAEDHDSTEQSSDASGTFFTDVPGCKLKSSWCFWILF